VTADGRETVGHALQAAPPPRRARVEPLAVVAHLERELVGSLGHPDVHARRVRVLRHVLERLEAAEVQRGLDLLREALEWHSDTVFRA